MRCRRTRRQRGAVLVETALTLPIMFMLIFGIVEVGLMMRDYVALNGVGHDAARAAAIGGDDLSADHHILEVIAASAAPLEAEAITRVIVFEADGPSATVPPDCLTGPQDTMVARCNVYLTADLDRPITDFGCQHLVSPDRFWCPADRIVARTAANGGPPDYVGVYIELDRDLVTGLFGGHQTLTVTNVARIEPRDL